MNVNLDESHRYLSDLADEDILRMHASGRLTDNACIVLEKELTHRGIPIPQRAEEDESPYRRQSHLSLDDWEKYYISLNTEVLLDLLASSGLIHPEMVKIIVLSRGLKKNEIENIVKEKRAITEKNVKESLDIGPNWHGHRDSQDPMSEASNWHERNTVSEDSLKAEELERNVQRASSWLAVPSGFLFAWAASRNESGAALYGYAALGFLLGWVLLYSYQYICELVDLFLNYDAREKHLRVNEQTATISAGIVLFAAIAMLLIFLNN